MRVELSEAARLDLLAYLDLGPDDAPTLEDDGSLVFPGRVPEETITAAIAACAGSHLTKLRQRLRAAIDRAAEAERLKYITGGAGQAMTYQRKVEEARMADAEADPVAADYPLLAASVGIDGQTVADVADLVLAMDAQWSVIGAAIEAARRAGKQAVAEAADEAAVRAAFEAVAWPG